MEVLAEGGGNTEWYMYQLWPYDCYRNESYNYCGCYFTKNIEHTHMGGQKSLIPFQFHLPHNID